MGLVLTDEGIGPTEDKVRPIVDARESHNASEVRSILGLANYSDRLIQILPQSLNRYADQLRKVSAFNLEMGRGRHSLSLREGSQVPKLLDISRKDAKTLIVAVHSRVAMSDENNQLRK